ncbi:site-specific DNA-methyltransferase [Jeotgalibacillus sp. R-1-5s-1]|uniref:site-specific DNA-methyltransferase n=1 Tax=Jeotgalibacillus sp. R-1-5s-1 TaxID=2555897 RepID=UPI00106BA59A|nr:site-specific DNA-methyltransferase [Jeotgalibacillus sp. R-1-5s-1]TFD99515.1 site-specific DNA-methyltransferase [Jeotgalibacillus sp. R-1-5s-1]
MTTTQQKKFIDLLNEIFQFDQADLDFGIYRIMNQKRDEVTKFLEKDLVPQVQKAFEKYKNADIETIKQQIEDLEKKLSDMGVAKESSEKYKTLTEQLNQGVDVTALENEVFSNLTSFFRRYYDNGDFISLRRYKKNVYSIPYEGEEVKLHWANSEQYYVKTSEYFRDYTFKLPSERTVHFKLIEANTEQNNNKAQEGKERRFILFEEDPIKEENGELFIHFEYRPAKGNQTQKQLNESTLEKIFSIKGNAEWLQELQTLSPTEKNKKRTILEKYLNDYTARNTFDYFIHKDLGGFLRRELDFFIKNEIMHLDDLDTENEKRFEQYLSKVKVIKSIGQKIIAFLEQIENFQKKLWLKNKFVVETNYCITLDRIPEEFYEEISQNVQQINEWIKLFAIDEIKANTVSVGFSKPLSVEFLKSNPYLMIDTKFYDDDFKVRLLSSFENIEENLNGLLVHSENFQALQLLSEKYKNKVKLIYIDPPYNTSEETFIYKNQYKHSSWISMIADRVINAKKYLTKDGVLQITIDDEEVYRLKNLFDSLWGGNSYIGTVVVQSNPRGRGINSYYATSHEYLLNFSNNPENVKIIDMPLTDEQKKDYRYEDETSPYRLLPFRRSGGLSTPDERPNSEFALYYSPSKDMIVGVGGERIVPYPAEYKTNSIFFIPSNGSNIEELSVDNFFKVAPKDIKCIMPIDSEGRRRVWRWSDRAKILDAALEKEFVIQESNNKFIVQLKDRIKEGRKPKTIWHDSKYDASSHGTNLLQDILGERRVFGYPKSIYSTIDSIYSIVGKNKEATIFDFFSGSGTTGHSVINLNREDNGNRKYILVEMGEYFKTVTKPRIQKVIYSKDWKDGKPVSREGSSHMFKYIKLESYEDALNNIKLMRSSQQQTAINEFMSPEAKEEYLLSYMLDVEAEGSSSLLNVGSFNNPFDYKMMITKGTESTPTKVDLVETFNYLIGLHVNTIDVIKGIKVITGILRTGENTLVIWRNTKEVTNEQLEDFFKKQGYNTRDSEFERIYVNGDNHLENLKLAENKWKVVLIEEEFKRLMFDVKDM